MASVLASWPVARLAEQTIVVPVQEGDVQAVSSEVTSGVGGVTLFGSIAPSNLGTSLALLGRKAPGAIAPFVMVDEEGGTVQRLSNLVGSLPSARQMGATLSAGAIDEAGYSLGVKLKRFGVTMDLAPVLDVDGRAGPNKLDAIGTRSFSANETVAQKDGIAFAAGLERSGVVPVVKHFPGLGDASGNSDLGPSHSSSWSTLRRGGLLPFAAAVAAHVPALLVSNETIPGLSSLPASISPAVINRVLRHDLGYKGLVLTDSLSVGSLSQIGYSVPRASVAALEAGADMVLFSADASKVSALTARIVASVVTAVQQGHLSRSQLTASVTRILSTKHTQLCA